MFKVPNQFRERRHPLLKSDDSAGNNGFFVIPHNKIKNYVFTVNASCGMGWEHVSVSVRANKMTSDATRCPTWEEMCTIKDLFWDYEDCVVQYHPPKSEYVNMHPYVLHLWRPTNQNIPSPPTKLV